MEQKISLTIKAFDITHSLELPEDCSAYDFIESAAMLAESIGFSPSIVIKALDKAIDSRL